MHPSIAGLLAFCDGETGAHRSRWIARHLKRCDRCQVQLRRIRHEKNELSPGGALLERENRQGLDVLLSAMANWRNNPGNARTSELKRRLLAQIETYLGSPAVSVVARPDMRAEELLGKAGEMLEVFLGPAAAAAVQDEVLGGLDYAGSEAYR